MEVQVSREAGRRERLEEMQEDCRNNHCHVVVSFIILPCGRDPKYPERSFIRNQRLAGANPVHILVQSD
jgi:hypothetical protein